MEFQRMIPEKSWVRILIASFILTVGFAIAWEVYARSLGYRPSLNDTSDLWTLRRAAVKQDSLVIIGTSRSLFDLDLDQIEKGLGMRPIQLGLVGSSPYPVFENLANDESFHGTMIVDLLPLLFMAPAGPPMEIAEKAIKRYQNQAESQKWGEYLAMLLEEKIAFLKQDDLTLSALLDRVSVPSRASFHPAPKLPPYFSTLDRERRTKMAEQAVTPGPLQNRVKFGWPPLFSPPPAPNWISPEAFGKNLRELIEARYQNIASFAAKLRARGVKVIFVRLPVTGKVKEIEDQTSPRAGIWSRILADTKYPGIYFEDYPELSQFQCPDWSHLSGPDSIEFTRRLVPHLLEALKKD